LIFRKIILYGKKKKSTHGHTKVIRVCTFFLDLEEIKKVILVMIVGGLAGSIMAVGGMASGVIGSIMS